MKFADDFTNSQFLAYCRVTHGSGALESHARADTRATAPTRTRVRARLDPTSAESHLDTRQGSGETRESTQKRATAKRATGRVAYCFPSSVGALLDGS